MSKVWLVARHEYLRHVQRKRFILALLSMPIFVLLIGGIGIISAVSQNKTAPVGLVDPGNVFPVIQPLPAKPMQLLKPVSVIRYATEQDARVDLDSGKLQAYFILDAHYLQNGRAVMIAHDQPGGNVEENVSDVLRYNLILQQPSVYRQRLIDGQSLVISSIDGKRQMAENNIAGIILPILMGILFMIAINTSGGYLMQALVEEKENRTMEIMVTSMSPDQLMAAKIIGNLAGLMNGSFPDRWRQN